MASFLLSCFLFMLTGVTDYDALIRNYLQKELTEYSSIEVLSIQYPSGVTEGTTQLQIDNAKPCFVNGGFAYIPITLTTGKTKLHSVLTVKLMLFAPVWVANRPLAVATELIKADFRLEKKDVTKVKGGFVSKDFTFDRTIASMYINEGVILTQNMMRERPLIKYGDELTGYISVGGAEVSLQVIARDNGYAGGTIRVVSKDKKVYKGIVESESRVKIVE